MYVSHIDILISHVFKIYPECNHVLLSSLVPICSKFLPPLPCIITVASSCFILHSVILAATGLILFQYRTLQRIFTLLTGENSLQDPTRFSPIPLAPFIPTSVHLSFQSIIDSVSSSCNGHPCFPLNIGEHT